LKITKVEVFILHVPVTRGRIADSTHQLTHWGAPGVILHTDAGLRGYGYTGTHAHLPTDRLIVDCISHSYAPLLLGEDPADVSRLWTKLYRFPPVQWVGRCGITTLALSAIDVALWDLKAKVAQQPLWKLLGGAADKRLQAYNTDGGWLNWSDEEVVSDARRMVEEEGFPGVKIKVGSENVERDVLRVEKVRKAIGPHARLLVDANGRWDLPAALTFAGHVAGSDVGWLEEPLWYDDLQGHADLAGRTTIPIALGEQLYCFDHFRNFITAGAVHYVQPDAVRLAGITEWLRVADLARAHSLPVAAHVGDMMQVHLQLSISHPACSELEYIPWLRECFQEPATVKGGFFMVPEQPGAGTSLLDSALERFNVGATWT
jgi:L-alanine-DL-glutamate epimerase-like enolase superfamily enzyme